MSLINFNMQQNMIWWFLNAYADAILQ